ncbi:MAG: helix-turn-helix transcriptional regulator [Caldilineaceae bacterium]
MSIKHVLLALLAEEPTHGYELKKRYDETLGELWPLQQAQIYNNLRLLEKAGQIELDVRVAQENLPDQKLYRVTQPGVTELNEWISTPVQSSRQLKDDFYLKLTTLASIIDDPAQLADLIWQQRTIYLQHLRDLERALGEAEAAGDQVTASLLDGALLHAEADLTWLDRCEERLLRPGGGQ